MRGSRKERDISMTNTEQWNDEQVVEVIEFEKVSVNSELLELM